MEQLRNIVRLKLDEMRTAGYAQRYNREELLAVLSSSVPTNMDSMSKHPSSVIHLCPWHTCQATRHG